MATFPAIPTSTPTDPFGALDQQLLNGDPFDRLDAQLRRENPQESAQRAARFMQEQRAMGELARSNTGMLSPERFRQLVPSTPAERAESDRATAIRRAQMPFMAQVGDELIAGAGDVVRDTARSVEMLGGMVSPRIGEDLRQTAAKVAQNADEYSQLAPTPEGAGTVRGVLLGAARSVPGLATQMVAGQGAGMIFQNAPKLAGFAAFAGTAAAPVVGQTFQEARSAWLDRGADPATAEEMARTEALVAGGVTVVTNKLPFDKLVMKSPEAQEALRSSVTRAIKRFGAGAVAEGSQEVLEQVGQDLAQYTLRQDNNAFGDKGVMGYVGGTLVPTFGSAAIAGGTLNVARGGQGLDAGERKYTGPDGVERTITAEQAAQLDERARMNEQSRVEREGMGLEPSRPEDLLRRRALGVGPSAAGTTAEPAATANGGPIVGIDGRSVVDQASQQQPQNRQQPQQGQPSPASPPTLDQLSNADLARLAEMNGIKPTKNRVTMIGRLRELGADPADLGPPALQTPPAADSALQPVESGQAANSPATPESSTTVESAGPEFNQTGQNENSTAPMGTTAFDEPNPQAERRTPPPPSSTPPATLPPPQREVRFVEPRAGREAMSPEEQEAVRLVSSLSETPVRFIGADGEELGGAKGLYVPGEEGRAGRIYISDAERKGRLPGLLPDRESFGAEVQAIAERIGSVGEGESGLGERAWAIEQERRRAVRADPMTATALHEVTHALAEEQPYLVEQLAETLAPEVSAAAHGYIADLRRLAQQWVRKGAGSTVGSAARANAERTARGLYAEANRLETQHRQMIEANTPYASDLMQEGVARLMEARADGRGVASLYRAATNQGILQRAMNRILNLLAKVGLGDRINAQLRKALTDAARYMELKRTGDAKLGVTSETQTATATREPRGRGRMAPGQVDQQGGTEPTPEELATVERAVKTAVSERGQGRNVGRPELANPGLNEEARGLVDAADRLRKDAKEPETRRQAEAFAEGSKMLSGDYAGTREKIIAKARRGEVLTDAETAAAKAITDSEGWAAVVSGDAKQLWRAMQFAEAYRATGTAAGRALAIRRDQIMSPAERARAQISEALLYPDNFAVAALKRLRAARESIIEQPTTTEQQKIDRQEKLDAVDRKIRDQARRVAKKRAEVIQNLRGLGINIETLTDAQLTDVEFVARITKMASIAGADWSDRMYEFWINSILSGWQTHTVNIVGTNIYGAWEVWAQRALEAAAGKAIGNKNAPVFGEYAAMIAAIPSAAAQTARRTLRALRTGVPLFEDEVMGTVGESLAKIEQGRGAKIAGVKGEIVRIPTRMLAVEDDFAKSWIGTLEAHAYAYRLATQKGLKGRERWAWVNENVNSMNPEVWGHAVDYAKEKTFNNEAQGLATLARQIRRGVPGAAYVLPFINTPQNLFVRAIEKTPFGVLIKGLKALAVHSGAINWHPSTVGWTYDKSEATRDIANAIFAAAMTALMWELTEPGEDDLPMITGSRTPSQGGGPDTAGLANRTAPPMSIRIGGTWYSYGRLDPFSTILATTVDGMNAVRAVGQGGDPITPIAGTITSLKQSVMDRTFLQGVGDLVRAIDDVGPNPKAMVRWGQNFAVSWVPNIVRSTARATDENVRSSRIAADPGSPFWNEALLRLRQGALPAPGLGNAPPIRYDLWGREMKNAPTGNPATDFVYRLLSPVQARQIPDDQAKRLDLLLTRWNQANPDNLKAPRSPQEYIAREVNGKSVTRYMSDEDYAAFVRDSGREAVKLLSRARLNYDKPELKDVQLIEEGIRAARQKVLAEMKIEKKLFPELYTRTLKQQEGRK
ncbi:hypothetical protein [Tolypothrix sp. VBCCA 56010]|uniref:hypothetical protein n=1 Tax=Tolypothrix sp. VBCCA 56010 TaxID=3137731 RepID=UPI003D7E1C8B